MPNVPNLKSYPLISSKDSRKLMKKFPQPQKLVIVVEHQKPFQIYLLFPTNSFEHYQSINDFLISIQMQLSAYTYALPF